MQRTTAPRHLVMPFPESQPPGYTWLDDEPPFDPNLHLALETPGEIVLLTDLGYATEEIADKATPVAASSPFRLLSDEGADVMAETARRLDTFIKPAGERIERVVRGGCYRSRWLRDLCLSQEVAEHLSAIYGLPVAPHAMPTQLGHINYAPATLQKGIDKWHHDTLPLDYVLMVTDPATVDGGRFEYFLGTKQEAAELADRGETPPPHRVVAPTFAGAGWAIALHGDMVVHRAGPMESAGERVTMVNGYVAVDPWLDDQSRSADLIAVDDPAALYTEWSRYAAWRSASRLQSLIDDTDFGIDPDQVADRLEAAIADAQRAASEIRAGQVQLDHYGG